MEKKFIFLLVIILCIVNTSGCNTLSNEGITNTTTKKETDNESTVVKNETVKIEEKYTQQLDTIQNLKEEWEIKDSKCEASYGEIIDLKEYGYAISDLDRDGKIEVIVSGWAGTGHSSYNRIFEYKDSNNVEEIVMHNEFYRDSQPDLLLQNAINENYTSEDEVINTFIDDEGNNNYFVVDKEYWGSRGGEIRYFLMKIKDNTYTCDLIAYKQNDMEITKFFNANGEEIEEDDFNTLLGSVTEQNEITQISLRWFKDIFNENMEKSFEVFFQSGV